ncbi:MAG: hypothetical protein OEW12_09345, partial [Deltaproteobacteria bacterium]|nr:hypothetical protein [Deltaproteobacteria bacterium]
MNPESNPETNGAADNPAAAPPPPGMEGQPVPGQTQPPPRIPSLSDKINWPTFGWLELTITLVLVGMVAGYFFTLTSWHQKWLEGRRQKKKWIAAQAGLDRAGLNPAEMESLEILADAQNQGELLDFLSIPPHLEISLHETLKHEPPERWGFTTRLRQAFRYQSYNLQIPLVSTRQLSLGDHVRITLWGGVMPKNYYGRVVESTLSNFAVELGGGGLEDAWEKKPEMDLYVLRSPDLETPFPCQVGGPSEQETRIV